MADSQTPMQAHLREYVADAIQQKVRLANKITSYRKQESKSRERTIDETTLLNGSTNLPADKKALIEERRDMDSAAFNRVQRILSELSEEIEGVSLRMNVHLEELSAIEIATGGFVTHSIGVDKNATLDSDSMIVTFEPQGHAEIAIGVRLAEWKDNSQVTIRPIKKK